MMNGPMSKLIEQLRRSVPFEQEPVRSDAQLLDCFVRRHDVGALEALVRRHAALVWRVCLRVLRQPQDAEDAFQATFVVLVRKAGSIRPRHSVGAWLYGVARQTALNVRTARARRHMRERSLTDVPEPTAAAPQPSPELHALLDQQLARLPEKYRTVLLLCDLAGKTKREVAQQLGVPEGTVASRFARGRALLAKRLAAKAAGLCSGALAAALAGDPVSASAPPALLASTIHAVMHIAAGQSAAGLVSAEVAALSEGTVKAMLLTKLKTVAGLLLGVCFLVGAGALVERSPGEDLPAQPRPALPAADDPAPAVAQGRPQDGSFEDFLGRFSLGEAEVKAPAGLELPRQPILFRFDIDERSYLRYQRLVAAGKVKVAGSALALGLADEANFPRTAVMLAFEKDFDAATGTLGVWGVAANADGLLRPGMFVRVRMPFGLPAPPLEKLKEYQLDATLYEETPAGQRQVLATPRVRTLAGREAIFQLGRQVQPGAEQVTTGPVLRVVPAPEGDRIRVQMVLENVEFVELRDDSVRLRSEQARLSRVVKAGEIIRLQGSKVNGKDIWAEVSLRPAP